MNILLRYYNGKHYVWKQAEWKGQRYRLTDTDEVINQTSILAVTEDPRIGFVICNNCGELVANNPESIEAHYKAIEDKKDCFTCSKLTTYGDKEHFQREYKANEDGTYKVIDSYDTLLGCKMSYVTERIGSKNANRNCIYTRCRRYGVSEINDVFVKYPGLFERNITIDTIDTKTCTFEGYENGYFIYDLKMRGTIKACVNEMGIIDHFIFNRGGWPYNFFYSDKYKKIFFQNWETYTDAVHDYMNRAKETKVIEKISKLYEEANSNE